VVERNESLVQITYHVLHLGSKLFDGGFDAIFFRAFSKSGDENAGRKNETLPRETF
jgi:hypothetical protein